MLNKWQLLLCEIASIWLTCFAIATSLFTSFVLRYNFNYSFFIHIIIWLTFFYRYHDGMLLYSLFLRNNMLFCIVDAAHTKGWICLYLFFLLKLHCFFVWVPSNMMWINASSWARLNNSVSMREPLQEENQSSFMARISNRECYV
jgi:hypothetical protein